jgi:hypothetical protein
VPKESMRWSFIFAVVCLVLVFSFQNCAKNNGGYTGVVNSASGGSTTSSSTSSTSTSSTTTSSTSSTVPVNTAAQITQYETYRTGSPTDLPRFDYMFTGDQSAGAYQASNSYMNLYLYATSTRIPLYRCLIQYNGGDSKGPYSHFFSATTNCDGVSGAIQDAPAGQQYILGYVERNSASGASTPIYRCYDANLNRWRLATATSQCAQMKMSVASSTPLGYVPSANVNTSVGIIFYIERPFTIPPGQPYAGAWNSAAVLDQRATQDGFNSCITVNTVFVHYGFGPCLTLTANQ